MTHPVTTPVDISPEAVERLCNDIDDPFTTGMDRLELVGVIRALAAERDELAQKLTAMSAERDEYRRMSGGYYNEAATAYEQRDEARRALTASEKDAARWRWVRNLWHWSDERDMGPGGRFWCAIMVNKGRPTLEDHIDTAMEKANG